MHRRISLSSLSTVRKGLVGKNNEFTVVNHTASAYACVAPLPKRHLSSSSADSSRRSQEMSSDLRKSVTRVLFCGSQFPASHNYTIEYLQNYPSIKVDVVPYEDVSNVIGNYDICVLKGMRLNSDIIATANNMKLIMQFGVGLEGVDVNSASEHGIKVARIPSDGTGNAASCAEMAIYLMLGLLRKQYEMQVAVSEKKLGEPTGDTLLGKRIFILGYGNLGINLAKRLQPFGVKILATKRSWPVSDDDDAHVDLIDEKGNPQDILRFASRADIVVCCLAMNKETAGIINEDFISSMRRGALLINIARGGLLEYEAVLRNLKSGHLGGLGTDVAWNEPFDPNDPILSFSNVIMTPHVAGVTEYSYRYMAKVVGDVALQLHEGKTWTGIEVIN